MDTVTRVQILDETDCISHSTNTLGKGMNPIILPPTGLIVAQTGFFNLGEATSVGVGKLVKLRLKIDRVSYPARAEGLGKYGLKMKLSTNYSLTNHIWTPTYGRAKAGRPARTYIRQLCEDTGCCPEDLPEAMNDREKWLERVRDIRAGGTTWWYIYIYIYMIWRWITHRGWYNLKHLPTNITTATRFINSIIILAVPVV